MVIVPQVGAGDTAIVRRQCGRKFGHQCGQAMVEALIAAALVLVPLFLAIPLLAKYMDIKAYTVQSARYAAWERTVWFGGDAAAAMGIGSGATLSNKWDANEKSDESIRFEIGKRLLSDTGTAAFSSTDSTEAPVRALWRDRRNTPLLQAYGNNSVGFDNDKSPGLINDILTPVVGITSVVSNFTLDTKAQYTSKVGITVQPVAFNTDKGMGGCPTCTPDFIVASGTPMSFADKNVLVANGWSANGPGSLAQYGTNPEQITVYNQIRGLTPTSFLKPANGVFKDVLDVLQSIALVFFPELSTLDLGRIDVDKVPGDRIP